MTRTCKAIVKIFRALDVDLPANDYEIRRTHAGHHQRSSGAWSWFLFSKKDYYAINHGSQWPAREIIRRRKQARLYRNQFGDSEIDLP